MADDTEPRNDAGEEPENYDYDENNNSDDNPAQPSSDDTTPVVPSQQEPSNDDNIVDEDQAAADAAAADAAAAANSDGNGNQDSYDAEYDDEPLPDVTVNLYINELGDAAVTDSVNDYLTDQYGNRIGFDTTTIVQDLIDGNGTATGKHGWLGSWSWNKSLLVGLIALCVIGILLSLVCLVIGKRSKRNNPGQGSAGGSTTTKKAVVTKGLTPDTKYAPVPTDV